MNKVLKYTSKNARADLPKRKSHDNKTSGGKCLVIAGSKGLFGAAILSCLAASRSGAGYTYLISSGQFPVYRHPDFLLATKQRPQFCNFDAIAMGPGFRNTKKIKSYLKILQKQKVEKVVLDAEVLNVLAHTQQKLLPSWLLTPHEGELSRLLKVPSKLIREDRKKYLLLAQKKLGCAVLLKGYKTLIADGASVYEIQSGNPALAKAGTGDVLTGMILGFMSQNMSSTSAAKLAAYIHGRIADDWVQSGQDVLSLMASDIIELLPRTLAKLRRKE